MALLENELIEKKNTEQSAFPGKLYEPQFISFQARSPF